MHQLLIILFLLSASYSSGQDLDTTITIKTENSYIHLVYKRIQSEDGSFTSSTAFGLRYIFGSQVLWEAATKNIDKDQLIARLIVSEACEPEGFEITKHAVLENLNTEFLNYFKEFRQAFDDHHLSRFFISQREQGGCSLNQLVFEVDFEYPD